MSTNSHHLNAAMQAVKHDGLKIHPASRLYKMSYSALQNNLQAAMAGTCKGQCRPPCRSVTKKKIIEYENLDFADSEFSSRKDNILDVMKLFVIPLPDVSSPSFPMKKNHSCLDFMARFMRQPAKLKMRPSHWHLDAEKTGREFANQGLALYTLGVAL